MNREGHTLHELERETGKDLASSDYWAQARAGVMAKWVERMKPDSVLDIGCGSGYLTARIANQSIDRVVGIDVNEESIEMARKRQTKAEFQVSDAFNLPFDSGEFDCIIFGDVIEHFREPSELIQETEFVLNDSGSILISVPAFRFLMGPHDDHNEHEERYTKNRLNAVCWKAGFMPVKARYTNFFPLVPYYFYQRVIEKPVPSSTRGSHGKSLNALKNLMLKLEVGIPWPVGVSLIAQYRRMGTYSGRMEYVKPKWFDD